MRFAAVSDIHGNLPAPERAAADITARGFLMPSQCRSTTVSA